MAIGFMLSLEKSNIDVENKNILILGAGGAGRTVAVKLAKTQKANKLVILNRTVEKANDICNLIKNNSETETICDGDDKLNEYAKSADILINTTPLGMHLVNKDFENFDFLENMGDAVVVDLIYNPKETRLLKKAKELGLKALNGLDMLIFQALLSDEIYLKKKLDLDRLYAEVKRKLEDHIYG